MHNCESCKDAIEHCKESNKRLWVLVIVLASMLFATNIAWLIYESQFEFYEVTETYHADSGDDGVAIANGGGNVNYGNGYLYEESQGQKEEKAEWEHNQSKNHKEEIN